ncbi:MAG: pirin family protein [Nitrospinae bacterium]|nr:pirin family protein [Nitrospinota bacterium]
MNVKTKALEINIFPPEVQGVGQFDGGRITEIKPIGFPGEGPEVRHTGPLFYWAWATAKGYGKIALHPHQAFEIMSYALEGEIGHYDTLGTKSRVKAGGAQVMQTGSGVSHEEETVADHNEFFQIWFEPNLRESVTQPPTYREFGQEDFPTQTRDGVVIKQIIGQGGPVTLQAEAAMQDILIQPGHSYRRDLSANRTLAIVVIDGKGVLVDETTLGKHYLEPRYFAVVHAGEPGTVAIQADADRPLRIALIEVPAKVNYPLYKEGK